MKYHIALSFAGEDREYVDQVAISLREHGVDVFYDKFEETNLWGKDLYGYLVDIYQNKALFTVMFVSEAYKNKLWTNHERKSAQARAFLESREYILPAMFDKEVEIPGLLKTTGYISLKDLSPEEFAQKVIKKLQATGVVLKIEERFHYSEEAKADIDFPLSEDNDVSEILTDLKSHDWYIQKPAIDKIFKLAWDKLSPNEIFVLGRNIYQCACGDEHRAKSIMNNLRQEMSKQPQEVAEHLVNGMFYEVYFNSKGDFRGQILKSRCLSQLLAIQSVKKYADCIGFIRRVLQPYRGNLVILPNPVPERVEVLIEVVEKDPPMINDLIFKGKSVLGDIEENADMWNHMWKLSFREFSISDLKESLSRGWHIPLNQIEFKSDKKYEDSTWFRLPENKTIQYPHSK